MVCLALIVVLRVSVENEPPLPGNDGRGSRPSSSQSQHEDIGRPRHVVQKRETSFCQLGHRLTSD